MSRGSHAFIDVALLQADSQECNTKAKENRMVIGDMLMQIEITAQARLSWLQYAPGVFRPLFAIRMKPLLAPTVHATFALWGSENIMQCDTL